MKISIRIDMDEQGNVHLKATEANKIPLVFMLEVAKQVILNPPKVPLVATAPAEVLDILDKRKNGGN